MNATATMASSTEEPTTVPASEETSPTSLYNNNGDDDSILYVWVPYSFFLFAVFVVLTVSFVKHTKRVLRRRRLMLDYLQANVLAKRPRIIRMFASSIRTKEAGDCLIHELNRESRRNFQTWSPEVAAYVASSPSSPRTDNVQFPGGRPLPPEGLGPPPHHLCPPAVPGIRIVDRLPGEQYGLEDSGQTRWLQTRMATCGYYNAAFSFDEDLGRTHARHMPPPPPRPACPGPCPTTRGGVVARCACVDFPQPPQLQGPCRSRCQHASGTDAPSSRLARSRHRAGDDHVVDESDSDCSGPSGPPTDGQCSPPSSDPSRGLGSKQTRRLETSPLTCWHCGSVVSTTGDDVRQAATSPRPKKKPLYKRQTACTDSFEVKPGPDLNLTPPTPSPPDHGWDSTSPGGGSGPSRTRRDTSSSSSKLRQSGRSASGSTEMSTLTFDSGPSSRTSSSLHPGKGPAGVPAQDDGMAKGLEVYTIEMNSSVPRQASLPNPGFVPKRATTDEELRRSVSVCLPYSDHLSPTTHHSLTETKSSPASRTENQGQRSSETTTVMTTTSSTDTLSSRAPLTTSQEHIIWLTESSAGNNIHQTLV